MSTPRGLFGRERQWKAVAALLEEVSTGCGRGVVLYGAPGSGKSRPLREVTGAATSVGFAVHAAVATGNGLFGVEQAVRKHHSDTGAAIPLLVAVDDVHRDRTAAVDLLSRLETLLAECQAAFVFTSDSAAFRADLRQTVFRLAGSVEQVQLGGLDQAATLALMTQLLGYPPDPGLRRMATETNGNPHLITELIEGLREELHNLSSSAGPRRRGLIGGAGVSR